jgi:hypothetical protein
MIEPQFTRNHELTTGQAESEVAATVEMRSVQDRQRLEDLPDVRETLDHLHGTANLVVRLYDEVASYPA